MRQRATDTAFSSLEEGDGEAEEEKVEVVVVVVQEKKEMVVVAAAVAGGECWCAGQGRRGSWGTEGW